MCIWSDPRIVPPEHCSSCCRAPRRSEAGPATSSSAMEGAVALIEPSEFDLVVIGTGLPESIVAA